MNALTPMTAYRTVQTPAVGKPKAPVSAAIKANQQQIAFLVAQGMTFEQAYGSMLRKERRRVVDVAAGRTAIGSPESFRPENGSFGGKIRAANAMGQIIDGIICTIDGVSYPSIKAASRATGLTEHYIKKLIAGIDPAPRCTARPCIIFGTRFVSVTKASEELRMSRGTINRRIEAGCIGYEWAAIAPQRAK